MTKTQDIEPGDVFGQLTVKKEAEPRKFPSGQYHRQFECQCSCENSALVLRMYLLSGHTTSCGCARTREYDGQTLGRYKIGARTGVRDSGGAAEYTARCTECGTSRQGSISTLRKAAQRACTCMQTKPGLGESTRMNTYRQTAPGRAAQLQNNAKRRAEEKGLLFSLDRLDLIERIARGVCEATGLPLDMSTNAGLNPWAPSLDRRDNSKGYTTDNVRVVCWAYNVGKGPWDENVFLRLARAIVDANPRTGV